MTEADLKATIQASGGGCCTLDSGQALLEKINRLEAADAYALLVTQLQSAKEPGDFRGRVLEVNFADLFVGQGVRLRYDAKRGMSGDVDFCWHFNDDHVFIEMKLLGQDQKTKEATAQQLNDTGFCSTLISDDTKDVARIQRDIVQKSSTRKFNPTPEKNWVNLVAIDVSELQLRTVDIWDCLLAARGNEHVRMHCHPAIQRPAVVGVFEPAGKTLTAEQADWVMCYHGVSDANTPHPRDYIHGVLFLFREPRDRAALSYRLSGEVVWNPSLIDDARAKQVLTAFHQIVPRAEFKTC
ncbi:hypothetical protein [Accumulibacter sp.]|uniref:hypothetical protein n=1 Tax=Accumulibacter sp. TaxID=2053492 RepID=UPI0028C4FCFD|nr:hypothetical protein [Accumulibacter sp.]